MKGATAGEQGRSAIASYNLGCLFDLVAEAVPERTAIVWDGQRISFAELKERSDRLAATMLRNGIRRGQTIGLMMHNSPAYIEALLAAWKIGAISFSINFRYVEHELIQILRNAQVNALVHGEDFTPIVSTVLPHIPPLHMRIVVERSETPSVGDDFLSYRDAVNGPVGDMDIRAAQSGDDRILIYTGGTTGTPKGVEWDHEALFFSALGGGAGLSKDPVTHPVELAHRAAAGRPAVLLISGPLMHGASMFGAFAGLYMGATIVLMRPARFDAELVWTLVEQERVNAFSVMGDTMVVPLLQAWEGNPGRWNATSLFNISSGGGMLSERNLSALKSHFPHVMLTNSIGSSEGGAIGHGVTDTCGDGFMILQPRADLAIIVDKERFAQPGEIGVLARTGHISRAYWQDPEKTADTYVTVGGRRWLLTGDLARLEADDSLRIYGRDSTSINTGGEKVFVEEVESVIRSHPDVIDAVVVGVPDERWGQAVTTILSVAEGASLDLTALREFCDGKLARYKLPQSMFLVPNVRRSPAGKADLQWAKAVAQGAGE